ncbi:hypothetical protein HOO65_070025 [Ceratocystis lukuohia]|uniref:Uncharacterized protein n=1 Tax=Ceratocystis lukuohia TaxID=2019550 RepID=A0ABR4MBB1_9PEZI
MFYVSSKAIQRCTKGLIVLSADGSSLSISFKLTLTSILHTILETYLHSFSKSCLSDFVSSFSQSPTLLFLPLHYHSNIPSHSASMQPWAITILLAFAGNAIAAATGGFVAPAKEDPKLSARVMVNGQDCWWKGVVCYCIKNGETVRADDDECPPLTRE